MIEAYAQAADPINVTTAQLSIARNSVIVLKVPRDRYDLDDMNLLRDYYQKTFPNNIVCVMFDDIEINIINDNTWHKRPCAEVPDVYTYN